MKRNALLFCLMALSTFGISQEQSVEDLTRERDEKAGQLAELEGQLTDLQGRVDGLKGEVASLTDQITPYPRWTTGAFGTLGFNFNTFTDWLSKNKPNTSAASIGVSLNALADLDQEKYFWRNGLNINLGWIKFDDRDVDTDSDGFGVSSDAFNLSSLFGYKISEKLAASVLGEYRTSVLEGRFNDPGYLDIGVGVTWTPMADLFVVIHPLNYNAVFASEGFDYQSSTGAKVLANYSKKLASGIGWKSNLSAFISYKDTEMFSNWTWINSFSTAYKGVGIGLELGLRKNKQEALARELEDNPLQTYWLLGLSYAIGG